MPVFVKENELKRELYRQNNTLSKNVRLLRILHGYKQQDMAAILHMSRTSYYGLECGGKTPDFSIVCKLAEIFNISLDYLISFDMNKQLLSLISVDNEDINALSFVEKYLSLSHSGRDQMKEAVQDLKEHEDSFNNFPWKYTNSIYERK